MRKELEFEVKKAKIFVMGQCLVLNLDTSTVNMAKIGCSEYGI